MQDFLSRFRHWAHATPDAIAVAHEDRTLTYRELDLASDQFARTLWAERQSDNDILGFLGDVGIARLVALLAVVKANMALYRLDPKDPAAALMDLATHAGTARIITEARFHPLAASILPSAPIVVSDRPAPADAGEPPLAVAVDPDALVTIRYTSGSTGRPKGVPQTRRKLDLRLQVKYGFFARPKPPETRHRYAVFNPFSDTDDLFSLALGDQIECFDFRANGPRAFALWLRERRITCLNAFTAMFRQLVAVAETDFPDLEELALVGEPSSRLDVERFDALTRPGAIFSNRFGSTEHGDVTRFVHVNGEPITFETAPLGRALALETVRLVDEEGADVADGQPGQLIVTTPYIPAAYHNDPERSAAVFKPAPSGNGDFSCHTGFMAYRDYAGVLHPVGRMDEQIKIRGYNVRPTEVEQMLQEHPGVAVAAVTSFEGPRGIRRLACHFTPASDPPPSAIDLRRFLAARGPNFMVPSVFLALDALPRTGTGKIKRQDLPDPMQAMAATAGTSRADVAAASTMESVVMRIWREILGHGEFGLDDDFFDVGGDSLQAMTMLMEIETTSGVRTPLGSLILEGASVRALAARIDALAKAEPGPVALKRGGDRPAIYALPVQGGHLSDYLQLLNCLDSNQSVFGVHPRGMDGRSPPDATMAALAAHAAATIRLQNPNGPYTLMGYSYGAVVAFETARRLTELGADVAALVLLEPIMPWTDALRDLRAIYRPLKRGDAIGAARQARNSLAAALGAQDPTTIDDAHRLAMRRYRPTPLAPTRSPPRTLTISALENPRHRATQQEWRRLLGDGLTTLERPGEHFTMIRAPHVSSLAQKLEAWLAAP